MPGSLGWRGFMRIGASGSVLPYLNADLAENIEILPSASIHGGGVGSVDGIYHSEHNFAIGRATYAGTVNGEVFSGTGNYANAFRSLLERAMGATSGDTSLRDTGFNAATPLIFSPGGGFQFKFPGAGANAKCVVNTFRINGNNGGIVNYAANIMSSGADYDASAVNKPNTSDFAYEPVQFGTEPTPDDDSNPLPYWASQFSFPGSNEASLVDGSSVTEWSIEINNNSSPIFTFNGKNYAVDILQGMMIVTGTFSYYSPDGTFVRNLKHGATLDIGMGLFSLHSPYVAFGPYPAPSPGPNAPTVRNVTFRCLAQASQDSLAIV